MEKENTTATLQICDLPEEILELILFHLSPYRDLKSAMFVCRQWHRLVLGVIRQLNQNFHQCLAESKMNWKIISPEVGSSITDRYSHCSCYYDKSVYIFGGCTSTNTTFNDLWRFDLKLRQWIRPLAIGTYPSPKAFASMVVYKDSLVLFGGWSHPTPYPLHQGAKFFSELHIYKPETNRWFHMNTMSQVSPSPTAGHSASIVGDKMVVFGGSHVPGRGYNEVWIFDFVDLMWQRKHTTAKKPSPRYGQTQVTIDENHILIIGGCGGPNQIFNDLWLLCMDTEPWSWEEITTRNAEFAAPQLWCHPACKVGDKMVILSKPTKPFTAKENQEPHSINYQKNRVWIPPKEQPQQHNVFPRQRSQSPQPGPSSAAGSRKEGSFKRPVSDTDDSSSADSDDNSVGSLSDRNHGEFKHPADVLRPSGSRGHSSPTPGGSTRQHGRASMSPSRLQAHSYFPSQTDSIRPPLQEQLQAFNTNSSSPRHGMPSIRPNAMKNREKQLEALRKFEEKLRESLGNQNPSQGPSDSPQRNRYCPQSPAVAPRSRDQRSPMHLHVLDISEVISSRVAKWQPIKENLSCEAPEETIFYSLVQGRGELIMFGGIQRDVQNMQRGMDMKSQVVSNNLYILSPRKPSL